MEKIEIKKRGPKNKIYRLETGSYSHARDRISQLKRAGDMPDCVNYCECLMRAALESRNEKGQYNCVCAVGCASYLQTSRLYDIRQESAIAWA